MQAVSVRIKYSSTGGNLNAFTTTSVMVSKKPPTESEVIAVIKKKHPRCNFVVIAIK